MQIQTAGFILRFTLFYRVPEYIKTPLYALNKATLPKIQ